jgi:hypothetical protein
VADIYKWTDKDGILHYSDVAPDKDQHIKDVVVATRSSRQASTTCRADAAGIAGEDPEPRTANPGAAQ